MRENFTYGSVRGATGDGGPYRDRPSADSINTRLRCDIRFFAIRSNIVPL